MSTVSLFLCVCSYTPWTAHGGGGYLIFLSDLLNYIVVFLARSAFFWHRKNLIQLEISTSHVNLFSDFLSVFMFFSFQFVSGFSHFVFTDSPIFLGIIRFVVLKTKVILMICHVFLILRCFQCLRFVVVFFSPGLEASFFGIERI